MKSKYVILASALLISVATFAQKNELKEADKVLKKGEAQAALTILQGAESLMANASVEQKAQFLSLKGDALLALANKNVDTDKNLSLAAAAFQELIATEKASGKSKYSAEAATSIVTIKNKLINASIADSKAEKHAEGASKLYDAYLLDKKDTVYLYYAASTYVAAKNYDKALELYDILKKLNYSGKGTSYLAVSKITGEENAYATAEERDRAVKLGTHEKPRTEQIESKRGEIYKNIALILVQNGKVEEAKKAIADARVANPDDTSLTLTEANLYLDTKDFEKYKALISEVLEKNPNDEGLLFNLGVISGNAGNYVDAEKYYLKAIAIKPDYTNAYLNLAIIKLDADKKIVDEINKLGTSEKDNKRYEALKKQREVLFKNALPYLEKATELDPNNKEVKTTLLSVYRALEMTDKAKELKAKM
jgi:tetratricopeptide (TPR) repeat protein